MNSPIRLRQHGTLFSCSQKNSQRDFFCEQDLLASALPEPALSVVEWGDIPHQMQDHLNPWQQWPFRGFRPFRGIHGPNSHRVTRINVKMAYSAPLGRNSPARGELRNA
jgi:hypothetical protein